MAGVGLQLPHEDGQEETSHDQGRSKGDDGPPHGGHDERHRSSQEVEGALGEDAAPQRPPLTDPCNEPWTEDRPQRGSQTDHHHGLPDGALRGTEVLGQPGADE